MKVLIECDAHLLKAPDGTYWCDAIYKYSFWERYLTVFDELRIVARTKNVNKIDEKWMRVDGEGIEIFEVPFYQGPWQLAKKYFKIHKILNSADLGCDAALFRMPSQTAYMTYHHFNKNLPYAGEIVYDPTDDVNDKSNNILMRILNKRISSQLRKFCASANGVSYVTEHTIQKHYPSRARIQGESKNYFETFYSTITLEKEAFTGPRDFTGKTSFTLVLSDVAMNSERKGERTLLKAMRKVLDRGYDLNAIIIGDGSKKDEFIQLSKELGLSSRVEFTGLLPSADEVRAKLLKSDIFVFPTRAEGLPRGILEAMAVGLPVLSSPVGGIPEVVDDEYLYEPDDIEGYVSGICRLLDNTDLLNEISRTNFQKVQEYRNEVLQEKRQHFYTWIKNLAIEKERIY
ncbi:glycosyltransferase [Clostridium perfringens]|nr:glycosyltransferase [Clostridium perfringens]